MKRQFWVALGLGIGLALGPATSARSDGNVKVKVKNNGDIVITGDNADNTFVMMSDDANTFTIVPDGTTSINGDTPGNALTFDHPVPVGKLTINMKGGDDDIDVSSTDNERNFKSLSYKGGKGNDRAVFDDFTVQKNALFDLGKGTAGLDTYGGGNDQVLQVFSGVDVGKKLTVKSGNSNDVITFDGEVGNENQVGGKTSIKTGDGFDRVVLDATQFAQKVSVKTGKGDDTIRVSDSIFNAKTTIDGGKDDDTALDTSSATGTITFKNVENVIP